MDNGSNQLDFNKCFDGRFIWRAQIRVDGKTSGFLNEFLDPKVKRIRSSETGNSAMWETDELHRDLG